MPEKRLILHVGPHKTGSTSLQYGLLNSQSALNEQGFLYPDEGIAQFAHHQIYALFGGDAKGVGSLTPASLLQSLSHADNVILSSEDFIYLTEARLTDLKNCFKDYRIEVILFVRTPVDLWPSHWQELVKNGRTETLLEYLSAYCGWTGTIDASIMNPFVQASKFSKVFGRDAIRMFSYDNIVESGEDIYDFFWRVVLELKTRPPIAERRHINPSLEPAVTEVLRCLNENYQGASGARPSDFILSRYLQHRKGIEASSAFAEFREAFITNASVVHLESTQELFKNRERMFMNNFGNKVENKAAPDKLHVKDIFKKKITYARRYWADRFGLNVWVNELLRDITKGA